MNVDGFHSSGTFSCAFFSLLCSTVGYELVEFENLLYILIVYIYVVGQDVFQYCIKLI